MCDDEVQVCQPIADACGGAWWRVVASARTRERAHIRRVACELWASRDLMPEIRAQPTSGRGRFPLI